jgi:predicted Rossmann-fold nucleotide-binding protein
MKATPRLTTRRSTSTSTFPDDETGALKLLDAKPEVPFQPIRPNLYSSLELLLGFDSTKPESYITTLDFQSYQYYVATGGAASTDPYAGMMEALHDNSIMRAMTRYLRDTAKPIVAIMGGHNEERKTDNFADVVDIARRLTRNGCLVASGGGPGAMEATHLGALLAGESEEVTAAAIKKLAKVSKLPDSSHLFDKATGIIDTATVEALHTWAAPAYEIAQDYPEGGESLAVPTWYYGNEPLSPLATKVAKYFQNSIREDVLLGLAANGIIYTPGAAGTLQEVFQDAAQNYYPAQGGAFAPMIFYGKDFWENTLPVLPVLRALFVVRKGMPEADFERLVTIADSVNEAVDKLLGHQPSAAKTEKRMKAMGFGPMMAANA